jgi:predicted HTH domain antitoxin
MASSRLAQASNQEGKILLAIQAYKKNQVSSLNKAATLYGISYPSLWHRFHGRTTQENVQSRN